MAYASGKKAWGISDRSGWRYRLHTMRTEWNGSKVGPDEWEEKEGVVAMPEEISEMKEKIQESVI